MSYEMIDYRFVLFKYDKSGSIPCYLTKNNNTFDYTIHAYKAYKMNKELFKDLLECKFNKYIEEDNFGLKNWNTTKIFVGVLLEDGPMKKFRLVKTISVGQEENGEFRFYYNETDYERRLSDIDLDKCYFNYKFDKGDAFSYDTELCNWVKYPHQDNKERLINIDTYINLKQNEVLISLIKNLSNEFGEKYQTRDTLSKKILELENINKSFN